MLKQARSFAHHPLNCGKGPMGSQLASLRVAAVLTAPASEPTQDSGQRVVSCSSISVLAKSQALAKPLLRNIMATLAGPHEHPRDQYTHGKP